MRIAFFIISLLFFLSWMIMSIIRADVWIAILAGVMVLNPCPLFTESTARRDRTPDEFHGTLPRKPRGSQKLKIFQNLLKNLRNIVYLP